MTIPSYTSKDIVSNGDIDRPTKFITIEEVATLGNVTVCTAKKWMRKAIHIRKYHVGKTIKYLYYDVQYWIESRKNTSKQKRSWKRGIANLKKALLVNRQTLLNKLQERHDKKWLDIAKKYNGYDDSHVEAYRRGVKDAIYILKNHGIEYFDYKPCLGQHVWVGGCVGEVTHISDEYFLVSGRYRYCSIGGYGSSYDDWCFRYNKSDVEKSDPRPWYGGEDVYTREKRTVWNFEDIDYEISQ